MARIFIIGATGGVGRRLCKMLTEAGHDITGLHRKPEQADHLSALGVTPVEGDIMTLTAHDLEPMLEAHDVVVFSAGAAGSGMERTARIDGEGPREVAEAMQRAGVSRFYLVSAFPEAGRGREPNPGFENYMLAKKEADAFVARSALDWVILRPGTLTDEDGNDQISAGYALSYGSVSRDHVAQTLAALIDTPQIKREIIELTDGNTRVSDALDALRRDL